MKNNTDETLIDLYELSCSVDCPEDLGAKLELAVAVRIEEMRALLVEYKKPRPSGKKPLRSLVNDLFNATREVVICEDYSNLSEQEITRCRKTVVELRNYLGL